MNDMNDKDYLLAEAILKLSALQRILVKKGILTEQELNEEMELVSKEILDYITSNKIDINELLINKTKN